MGYVKYDYPPEHPEQEDEHGSDLMKQGRYLHSGAMGRGARKRLEKLKKKWEEEDERR